MLLKIAVIALKETHLVARKPLSYSVAMHVFWASFAKEYCFDFEAYLVVSYSLQ